jgi:hypothetical protein
VTTVSGAVPRRALLAVPPALLLIPRPAAAGAAAAVGTYLPKSATREGLVTYTAVKGSTPSIRAGVLDVATPYSFDLPPTWVPQQVANIQSGNYCMPKCVEPWTETIFGDGDASARLVVSPLDRLTRRAVASITDIGPPDGVISSLGAFVTNNVPPEPEEVVSSETVTAPDGTPAYVYELNTPFGLNPPRAYAVATAKGGHVYLFVVASREKKWAGAKSVLRQVATSFKV